MNAHGLLDNRTPQNWRVDQWERGSEFRQRGRRNRSLTREDGNFDSVVALVRKFNFGKRGVCMSFGFKLKVSVQLAAVTGGVSVEKWTVCQPAQQAGDAVSRCHSAPHAGHCLNRLGISQRPKSIGSGSV